MLEPASVVTALEGAGFTHLVWIPDSHLGTWEPALANSKLAPIRVTREGEAIGIAAGLMLGGARPLVAIQCTGFFEAGDAVRNVAHDLKLPLKLIVGVRSWAAHASGKTTDNCPHLQPSSSPRVGTAAHAFRPDRRDGGSTRGRGSRIGRPTWARQHSLGGVIAMMTHRERSKCLAGNRGDHVVITTMGSVALWPHCRIRRATSTTFRRAWARACLDSGSPRETGDIGRGAGRRRRATMNLGCLVTAAQRGAARILLIDNGLYEVTGGQPVANASRYGLRRRRLAVGIGRVFTAASRGGVGNHRIRTHSPTRARRSSGWC